MTHRFALPLAACAFAVLAGCATVSLEETARPAAPPEPNLPPRAEVALAITQSSQLIRFNAGQPQQILSRVPITGLAAGDEILGLDLRAAQDAWYVLGRQRLYRLNPRSGELRAVGQPFAVALTGTDFGFDVNPAVDRIRVVSDAGQNLRLHPDTGAVLDADEQRPGVQTDPPLAYATGDANAGRTPRVVAAAYTYNKQNFRMTTNYALDAATGALVTQGTREGVTPAVSPNTGQLYTVGRLGFDFDRAEFDIHVFHGTAFAALTVRGESRSRWVLIDLNTGAATWLGTVGGGEAVRAMALEP